MGIEVTRWLAVGLAGHGVVSVAGDVDAIARVDRIVVDWLGVRPLCQLREVWCDERAEDAVRPTVGIGGSHVVGAWKPPRISHQIKWIGIYLSMPGRMIARTWLSSELAHYGLSYPGDFSAFWWCGRRSLPVCLDGSTSVDRLIFTERVAPNEHHLKLNPQPTLLKFIHYLSEGVHKAICFSIPDVKSVVSSHVETRLPRSTLRCTNIKLS